MKALFDLYFWGIHKIGRRDYSLRQIFFIIIGNLLLNIPGYPSLFIALTDSSYKMVGMIICVLIVGWGLITNTCRRLADLERSTLWVCLVFVPYINYLFFMYLACAPSKKVAIDESAQ